MPPSHLIDVVSQAYTAIEDAHALQAEADYLLDMAQTFRATASPERKRQADRMVKTLRALHALAVADACRIERKARALQRRYEDHEAAEAAADAADLAERITIAALREAHPLRVGGRVRVHTPYGSAMFHGQTGTVTGFDGDLVLVHLDGDDMVTRHRTHHLVPHLT